MDNSYLEEEKSMILSFTVSFGAKYLTGMVTSVSPNEAFSLIEKISFVPTTKFVDGAYYQKSPLI
jgi:hypothetical protein